MVTFPTIDMVMTGQNILVVTKAGNAGDASCESHLSVAACG